jgi:tetratricopeptide (TPR) repeat protein
MVASSGWTAILVAALGLLLLGSAQADELMDPQIPRSLKPLGPEPQGESTTESRPIDPSGGSDPSGRANAYANPADTSKSSQDAFAFWALSGFIAGAVVAGVSPLLLFLRRRILERGPEKAAEARAHLNQSALEAPSHALKSGHPAKALESLQAIVRRRPLDADARYLMGIALGLMGRHLDAQHQIEYAIRLNDVFLAVLLSDPLAQGFIGTPEYYSFVESQARRFAGRSAPGYA